MSFVYVAIEKNDVVYNCGLTPQHEDFFRPQLPTIADGFTKDKAPIQQIEEVKFFFQKHNDARIFIVAEAIVDDSEILAVADQLFGLSEEVEKDSKVAEIEALIENVLIAIEGGEECGEECGDSCDHKHEGQHNHVQKTGCGAKCECHGDKHAREGKPVLSIFQIALFIAAAALGVKLVLKFVKSQ